MGKQHKKVIKRRRRKLYLKRKDELEKQNAVRQKKTAKPAAEKATETAKKAPVKKAAKKAAKKAPAKKAPEKKDAE